VATDKQQKQPPGAPEEITPEIIAGWQRQAVQAHTMAFDETGNGLLVVGRHPLGIGDTVVLVGLDQLAIMAGAFLTNIVAPGIHAALNAPVQIPGQTFRPQGGAGGKTS
jgi:hypothetical protein